AQCAAVLHRRALDHRPQDLGRLADRRQVHTHSHLFVIAVRAQCPCSRHRHAHAACTTAQPGPGAGVVCYIIPVLGKYRRGGPGAGAACARASQVLRRTRWMIRGTSRCGSAPPLSWCSTVLAIATSGTANKAPTIPATMVPAATASSTATGCSFSDRLISSGCNRLLSACCTRSTTPSMISAVQIP